jgi:hypothetical protein
MKILTNSKMEDIRKLRFTDFSHFTDPQHPHYLLYQEREFERGHDTGWNNCLDHVLQIITGHTHIDGKML